MNDDSKTAAQLAKHKERIIDCLRRACPKDRPLDTDDAWRKIVAFVENRHDNRKLLIEVAQTMRTARKLLVRAIEAGEEYSLLAPDDLRIALAVMNKLGGDSRRGPKSGRGALMRTDHRFIYETYSAVTGLAPATDDGSYNRFVDAMCEALCANLGARGRRKAVANEMPWLNL
jgi:hypothetical protein